MNKKKFESMATYVKQKADNLSVNEREDLLDIFINLGTPDKKIVAKGGGTQIKIKFIPYVAMEAAYKFVEKALESRQEKMKKFFTTE